jgi:hypothetical protein
LAGARGLSRHARASAATLIVLALWGFVCSCGSSLPTPLTRPRPDQGPAPFEVPYPPPAARVEIIPPQPEGGAVWVDGEWSWQGKRWVWESGGWMAQPNHTYFSPWRTHREPSGKLFFSPGAWFDDKGKVVPKPAWLVPALTSLGDEGGAEAPAKAPPTGSAPPVGSAPPAASPSP